MFTGSNTLNEIFERKDMKSWFRFLHRQEVIDRIDLNDYDVPIRDAFAGFQEKDTSPQRLREQILETANLVCEIQEGTRQCLQLHTWKPWSPSEDSDLLDPANTFLITTKQDSTRKNRPLMLVTPGGGYDHIACRNEGTPIQSLAEERGYAACIIRYRVYPSLYPDPQEDMIAAIHYMKEHAEQWGADKGRLVLIGFSAGGHLVLSTTTYIHDHHIEDAAINGIALGYSVVSFREDVGHQGSVMHLLGEVTEQKRNALSMEQQIYEGFPPTFAWTCRTDASVKAENTELLEQALKQKQVPHECHIYPSGRHGIGLGRGTSAEGWSEAMFAFMNSNV